MIGVLPNALQRRAEVAQLVEHRTENAGVPSSSLGLGTIYYYVRTRSLRARGAAFGGTSFQRSLAAGRRSYFARWGPFIFPTSLRARGRRFARLPSRRSLAAGGATTSLGGPPLFPPPRCAARGSAARPAALLLRAVGRGARKNDHRADVPVLDDHDCYFAVSATTSNTRLTRPTGCASMRAIALAV